MPWHSHPAISSSLFWAVCSFPQPSWGRNPLTRTPHQCQGSPQSWDCSLQPIQAPLPAAPLAQPVDPCCPTTVQAVYYLQKSVSHSSSLRASKLDSNCINMTLTLHISMELFFLPTSDPLTVERSLSLRLIHTFEVSWQSCSLTAQ